MALARNQKTHMVSGVKQVQFIPLSPRKPSKNRVWPQPASIGLISVDCGLKAFSLSREFKASRRIQCRIDGIASGHSLIES